MNTPSIRFDQKWATAFAVALIVLAGFGAYWNSLSAPFIFDDIPAIVNNPSIHNLTEIGDVLSPPQADGSAVAGRPILNLSLAINYALGGLDVRGYHLVNLVVHLLTAVTLFGIVRRTLQRKGHRQARGLALLVALIWIVHPLLTESVTCVVQRGESMVGLFYLLSLYCFIRGAEASQREETTSKGRHWYFGSITAALVGMGTKEVMVTAPVVIFLYDRTFVAGSFRAAWSSSRKFYLGLAATWLELGYLVYHSGGSRGSAAGFGLGLSSWTYALTQARALALYLKLSVWPDPLVLDYGRSVVGSLGEVPGRILLLGLLLALTAYALFWRSTEKASEGVSGRRALGFVGAWFFLILAPSSSFVPLVTQTIAEHRMYLPLVAVVTLFVLGLHAATGRWAFGIGIGAAIGLGLITFARNQIYLSGVTIWRDTVAKCPGNPRAFNDLGLELAMIPGKSAEAIDAYNQALRLAPNYAEADNNLAIVFDATGRSELAISQYRKALELRPDYPEATAGLAVALGRAGHPSESISEFERALQLEPRSAELHYNYAIELALIPDRIEQSIREYQHALTLRPNYADAHYNLANLLSGITGRLPEAIVHYRAGLRLNPNNPEAHNNLGNAFAATVGHLSDAIAQYEEALRLNENYPEAQNNLAVAYANSGRSDLAVEHLKAALKLDPNFAGARDNLEKLQGSSQ